MHRQNLVEEISFFYCLLFMMGCSGEKIKHQNTIERGNVNDQRIIEASKKEPGFLVWIGGAISEFFGGGKEKEEEVEKEDVDLPPAIEKVQAKKPKEDEDLFENALEK